MAPSHLNHIARGSRVRELEFGMLGPLEVRADGALLDLRGRWAGRLLARLLLDANRAVTSDQLVADLLGERPSPSAMTALEASVSLLGRALGPDSIDTGPAGYTLRVDWTRTDVRRFERLASAGRERLAAGELVEAAETLRLALDLWRGEPLGAFGGEAWALPEVARLNELRLTIEDQVDAGLAIGSPAVLPMVERLVVNYPRRERLRGQLLLALQNAGRRAEALAAFNDARRFLTDAHGGPLANELGALMSYLWQQGMTLGPDTHEFIELGSPESSPITLAEAQPKVQPADPAAHRFDDWAFRLGRGEWPDPRTYLDLAGDNADELRLLMDRYIRALPRPAPASADIQRAQAWLAAAPVTKP
jgi:DNA-binding SARP family transcriptional activator